MRIAAISDGVQRLPHAIALLIRLSSDFVIERVPRQKGYTLIVHVGWNTFGVRSGWISEILNTPCSGSRS